MNTAKANTIVVDAYSDPSLQGAPNGVYSRFKNTLNVPVINAKSVQLKAASFVNSLLQLNDNSQLMFWFYYSTNLTGIRSLANLRCIRLHPSDFIANPGFTAFVRNKYYNSVVELVADLNASASAGGDSTTYNTRWGVNQVSFAYDTTSRRIRVLPLVSNGFVCVAAYDDPNILTALQNGDIRMNDATSSNTFATATIQPYVANITMNQRLGFGMSLNTRGKFWTASSVYGCATSSGIPQNSTGQMPIEAESFPILLASQNMNIYASIVNGSGQDAKTQRRNLLASIPIQVAPLNVSTFQPDYAGARCLTGLPQEIQEIDITMLDDNGQPFPQPPNFNFQLILGVEF